MQKKMRTVSDKDVTNALLSQPVIILNIVSGLL